MEKEGASCSGTGSTKCEWEKPMETFIVIVAGYVTEYKINNCYLVMLGVTQDAVLLIHPHLVVTVNLLFHTQTEYFHGLFRVIRATIHAANVASVYNY